MPQINICPSPIEPWEVGIKNMSATECVQGWCCLSLIHA